MNPKFTQLNKRITFQIYKLARDDMGGSIHTWHDGISAWAAVTPYKGNVKHRAHVDLKEGYYSIMIRYNENITENMRIKFNRQIFKIEKIINHNQADIFQIIYCREE